MGGVAGWLPVAGWTASAESDQLCIALGQACIDVGQGCIALGQVCVGAGQGCIDVGQGCIDARQGCIALGQVCIDAGHAWMTNPAAYSTDLDLYYIDYYGLRRRSSPPRASVGAVSLLFQLFNGAHIRVYRLTGGRVGGKVVGQPVVLLTTTGRKTGKARTVPLVSFEDGGDRFIVASAAGAPTHPAWYNNLAASPEVTIQLGPRTYRARAQTVTGEERARLWLRIVAAAPVFADYQKKAGGREIPVVRIEEPGGA